MSTAGLAGKTVAAARVRATRLPTLTGLRFVAGRSPVLQFGGWPHYCLGAPMARLELVAALPALASRLEPPSIAGPVTWRPAIGIYGPNELPLRFG